MKNHIRRWRALWNPDMYHGWGRTLRYFEGWYFKCVAPEGKAALAFIPGISIDAEGKAGAFVQVLDGQACQAYYYHFPAEEFKPSPHSFSLQLGNNFFSKDRIEIDLPDFKGSLRLKNTVPWPSTLGAPGIMGWYSFIPFMECYHGVVSMDHSLEGTMTIGRRVYDFEGGAGYVEKDWGTSFPSAWIWMQTNNFAESPGSSLMASVARIPWRGSFFIGFIAGFLHRGKLHRFASYTGAKMQAKLEGEMVKVAFKDKRYRLEILATKGPHGELISPIQGHMTGKLNESMQATVEVTFWEGEEKLYSGTGKNAGLELAGPVDILLSDSWRR